MNTHSLTQNSYLLKRLKFLKTPCPGTAKPLQDPSNQGNLSLNQHTQAIRQLQQTYYLERRCLL
ncbi:MAG: hypothetical protein KME45_18530 [Stenomitos rutilans HA7619-LM2]|nr:hypothetical protein [Stenomitos rutilans HA7619-LM2]